MVHRSNYFYEYVFEYLKFIFIRIKSSIEHINTLDDAKFKKLLQRIAEKTGRQVKYNFCFFFHFIKYLI